MSTDSDRKIFKSKSASRLQLNLNTPHSPSNLLSPAFTSPRNLRSPHRFSSFKFKAVTRPKSPESSVNSSRSNSPPLKPKDSTSRAKSLKSSLQTPAGIHREFDNRQIELVESQNKLLKLEFLVDGLKSELKMKDKENSMLIAKLQECTNKLEETTCQVAELEADLATSLKANRELGGSTTCSCEDYRKENMEMRSKLYRLLQRYKEMTLRCEKLESQTSESKSRVSIEELAVLEKQFREVEEAQGKLLSENTSLKAQLSDSNYSRFERILKLSTRLYKINHELSQLLHFVTAYQSGESLKLTALLGVNSTPTKSPHDSDAMELCEIEANQIAASLSSLKTKATELVALQCSSLVCLQQ